MLCLCLREEIIGEEEFENLKTSCAAWHLFTIKKLKFRLLLKVPKNLNMCPDVSGLCPSSVECSL